MPPIHDAARLGDLAEVTRLIEADPALVLAPDELGRLPLTHAAWYGNVEVVEYLLGQGAPADHASDSGWTGLHYASSRRGSSRALEALLKGGASPASVDADGWTPLITAAAVGLAKAVRCLLRHGTATLNHRSGSGATALYWAANSGGARVVAMLLEAGADPTIPTKEGATPLKAARRFAYHDCVALLEVRGDEEREGFYGRWLCFWGGLESRRVPSFPSSRIQSSHGLFQYAALGRHGSGPTCS